MSKFDSQVPAKSKGARLRSPVTTTGNPTSVTNEGGAAFARDAKSDLFLLAVSNFVGEDTFYEAAGDRDERFRNLVHTVTKQDPDWMQRFIPWLRFEALMRSASVVAAVEYARAGGPLPRKVVRESIGRADEVAEVFAYCKSRGYPFAGGLQRGVEDAARKYYTERNALKYDGGSRNVRMGDIIQVAHVRPSAKVPNDVYNAIQELPEDERGPALYEAKRKAFDKQSALFKWLLERRYGNEGDTSQLPMISLNREIMGLGGEVARARLITNPDQVAQAGVTWEALSGLGAMDKSAWEAMIPSMGYMALLRNLRNFDEQGVSDAVAQKVIAKLTDPEEVAKSRQLPYRFWSAYKNVKGLRWAYALEQALDLCVVNVPEFTGRTRTLVDTSGSMTASHMSGKSTMTPAELAAVFGAAVAKRNAGKSTLVGFASGTFEHTVKPGDSMLKIIEAFMARNGEVGHGTEIPRALKTYAGEDRIVLISDMQTRGGTQSAVPKNIPIYGFNLGGYAPSALKSGRDNQHEFGGMSDKTFAMISLLERGQNADWPF